jgi:UDP-N-acetylmuramyl pentapeptide phosphotransferase/UDP-N-acetylglucosamine-1-phosphate transferase
MIYILSVAFVVSALTAWGVKHFDILDHPNDRSSHSDPTPRGGGLGIVIGFFAGLLLIPDLSPAAVSTLIGIAICGGMAAALGLLDDVFTLNEKIKFLALAGISIALAAMAGPVTDLGYAVPWIIGLLGSALWVFTTANSVNFMDGSDGLMVACLIPAALVLAVMGEGGVQIASLSLVAALAGFSIWNAPLVHDRGKIFAGDVGSLGASVIFAGIALYWVVLSPTGSVWLVPVLIMPILADVLLTMAARARAGRRLFTPHRAHAFQLLIRMGLSHRRVAGIWGGLSLGFGALVILGNAGPMWTKPAVFLSSIAIAMILHRLVRNAARAKGLDVTQ